MAHELSQEKREEIIFKLTEMLDLTSDEYMTKLMEQVSLEYARGYLDAFVANAGDDNLRLFYQFVRTINMA